MAAPSASFTVIPLADVDPDSPVTTDLMNALRLNDQNLFAQLVGDPVSSPPFTPAAAHDHDGVNSAAIIGANLRHVGTAEVSGAAVASITFSGLDGNADKRYLVYGTIIRGIAGTVSDYQMRFNALSAGYQGTPTGLVTGIQIFSTILTSEAQTSVRFKADVHVQNLIQGVDSLGATARIEAQKINLLPATGFSAEQEDGGLSNITTPAPNITSISFHALTGGTVFAVGTRISLFKIEEN